MKIKNYLCCNFFIIACLFLFLNSFKGNYDDLFLSKKIYTKLNNSFEDTLVSKDSHNSISRMELRIQGEIRGIGELTYSHYPFSEVTLIILSGSINEEIKTDWYDERCLIKYRPKDSLVKGEIKIEFEVY